MFGRLCRKLPLRRGQDYIIIGNSAFPENLIRNLAAAENVIVIIIVINIIVIIIVTQGFQSDAK